jgi:hypothetical protein
MPSLLDKEGWTPTEVLGTIKSVTGQQPPQRLELQR